METLAKSTEAEKEQEVVVESCLWKRTVVGAKTDDWVTFEDVELS